MEEKIDFFEIKVDNSISIKIFENTLFYEEIEASGNLFEVNIPISKIRDISFKEKTIDKQSTGCNLFLNFIATLISSGAYPTEIEMENPKIKVKYTDGKRIKNLIISSKKLNLNTFKQLENQIKIPTKK